MSKTLRLVSKAVCIQGAELDDAPGAAASVERRGGTSEHLDPFEQTRIDEETSVVGGAEVLACAVDGDDEVGAPEAPFAGNWIGSVSASGRQTFSSPRPRSSSEAWRSPVTNDDRPAVRNGTNGLAARLQNCLARRHAR